MIRMWRGCWIKIQPWRCECQRQSFDTWCLLPKVHGNQQKYQANIKLLLKKMQSRNFSEKRSRNKNSQNENGNEKIKKKMQNIWLHQKMMFSTDKLCCCSIVNVKDIRTCKSILNWVYRWPKDTNLKLKWWSNMHPITSTGNFHFIHFFYDLIENVNFVTKICVLNFSSVSFVQRMQHLRILISPGQRFWCVCAMLNLTIVCFIYTFPTNYDFMYPPKI